MTISFTMRARLALTQMLRETVRGLPIDDANRKLGRAILLKVKIADAEMERLKTKLPGGNWQIEEPVVNAAPQVMRDLDETQADYLKTFLKGGKYGVDDDDWFEPLLTQLSAEQPASKKTASIR